MSMGVEFVHECGRVHGNGTMGIGMVWIKRIYGFCLWGWRWGSGYG